MPALRVARAASAVAAVAMRGASSAPAPLHKVVLDTNCVLDWLVFNDPGCAALAHHIEQRSVCWHTTAAMREELAHVLPRPAFARWRADIEQVLARFDEHSTRVDMAQHAAPPAPQCKDVDDQKFIDLCFAIGASWLFTRDRDLLVLAGAARVAGIEVMKPADWRGAHDAEVIGSTR